MNYVRVSCPSGDLSYLDPSYLRLFNLPMVSLSTHSAAQTSPQAWLSSLDVWRKGGGVMVTSMVHPGADLLAGPVFGRMNAESRAWGLLG